MNIGIEFDKLVEFMAKYFPENELFALNLGKVTVYFSAN